MSVPRAASVSDAGGSGLCSEALRDAGGLDQRFHACPSESRARREVCVKLLLTADCSTKSLGSWFRSDKCTACTHSRFVLTSEDELNSRDISRQVESGQQDSG